MPAAAVVFAALLAVAVPAVRAVDLPVTGGRLALSASAHNTKPRTVAFRALDGGIVAPFADPALGASLLIFASSASGQCRVEVALPAANWSPIGSDGATQAAPVTEL